MPFTVRSVTGDAPRRRRGSLRMCLLVALLVVFPAARAPAEPRPRVIVLTDFFKDPDDKQSMVRFLATASEFEIEGLIATSLAWGDGSVHPEWIHGLVDEYANVLPQLRRHERPDAPYPSAAALHEVVRGGAPVRRSLVGRDKGFSVPHPPGARDSRQCAKATQWIGVGKETPASRHIITVVDREDPRPIWVVVWGGAMDLAQALWQVRAERTPEQVEVFVGKLRVYQVSWQDTGSVWIWENFPQLFLIQSSQSHRGFYSEGPSDLRDEAWVDDNVRSGHGPLGGSYPRTGHPGIKEGDTPSFLYLAAPGLSDPEHPDWGCWGGRFQRLDPNRNFFVDAPDRHPQSATPERGLRWAVGRWNAAANRELAARMDWCVRAPDAANHPPVAVVDGDESRAVLWRTVKPGEKVILNAAGSRDPDGNHLRFRWWHYHEVGGFRQPAAIDHADRAVATVHVPKVGPTANLHVILEVHDSGQPPLVGYRRVILTRDGEDSPRP